MHSERREEPEWISGLHEEVSKVTDKTYASVVTFKAFSLPNGNSNSDQADTNTRCESGGDHLDFAGCWSLQYGTYEDDPASKTVTPFSAEAVHCQESRNGSK